MEPWSAKAESEYKVQALVKDLAEFNPMQSNHYCYYVFEVDGYRISVGPDYKGYGGVSFRIYQMIPGKDMLFVKSGKAKEVFDFLPERFAQAMIFHLNLLQ
jgi:hypothetical protein